MIESIKQKLRKFIIRFHLNQMIRGIILALAGILAVWLLMVFAEYVGYFNSSVRRILIFSYILFGGFIVYKQIIISLLKIYGVKKPMSDIEAAHYIGRYIPEINDKLTNLMQLSGENGKNGKTAVFLEKAIKQKSNELSPFDFKSIIDFRVNKKYLKFLFPPVIVIMALLISSPDLITEPSKRLAKYNTHYEKPKPFYITLKNNDLEVIQGSDLTLDVSVKGKNLPEKLYYKAGNERYRLIKVSNKQFEFTLRNIRKSKKFIITDGIIDSRQYQLTVRENPEILGYFINLDYPEYTDIKDKHNLSNGDLIVPRGTKIKWKFKAVNTDQISVLFGDEQTVHELNDKYELTKTAQKSFDYRITGKNKYVKAKDTLRFTVNVTPDRYPEIKLSLVDDTTTNGRIYFNGIIADDYGFTRLEFFWKKSEEEEYKHYKIKKIDKTVSKQTFFHSFKIDTLLKPGEEIKTYFKIWDNDEIQGPKYTKSEVYTKAEPTEEQIEAAIDESSENFKEKAKETSSKIEKMNQNFENLRKKLIEKENLDWDDKESIRKFLNETEQLKKRVEELQNELKEKTRQEEKLRKKNEDILQKEKKLKELMDKLLDEDLLKKIDELRKMLEKHNKENLRNDLEEMNQESIDLNKELERSLELFKRLEVEKDIQDAIDELKNLEKKQDRATDSEGNEEEKTKEQEEINRDFKKLKKKLNKAREKNSELEEPMDIKNTEDEEIKIDNKLEEALKNIKEGKSRQGSKSQKEAGEKMKQLSEKLQSMMQAMQQQSQGEDLRTIRELLENTIKLSIDQENLMNKFKNVSKDDPHFISLIQNQKELKQDLQKVKDSLYALSKRQLVIQSFINEEINDIDRNMSKAMEAMLALNTIGYTRMRDKNEAVKRQQYIMKSLNNIALMLSESMEQMKQQMRKKGNKQGSCKNPKPGKSGKPSLQQMQQQLNNSLKQMQQKMKQGKTPGMEGKSMSEELARAAAKQREIRKRLEELRKEMQSKGNPGERSIGETLKEMEQTEEDLVNKILNEQMLKRQEDILTRLLEHEKANREQEFEKKRKSEEAKKAERSNPEEYLEYKRIKEKETELLRMVPPELTPFYRKKINEYYLNLGR